jgi:cytochrome b-561 domain-containing protein 2
VLNFLVRKIVPYNKLSLYHATSGTLLYVLACVSISLGIYSNWFSNDAPFYLWYLCFAVTALLGLIITNQVMEKYVRPKINPSDLRINLKTSQSTKADKKLKK